MKLQTKISLAVLPMVATAIFSLGAWSVITAARGVEGAMYHMFDREMRDFVQTEIVKSHQLLMDNGLAKIPSYLERYQQIAIAAAKQLRVHSSGIMMIFNDTDQLILCTCQDSSDDPSLWSPLIKLIKERPGEYVQGHMDSGQGSQMYIGHYFAPWQWTLIYKIPAAALRESGRKIGNATLIAAAVCAVGGFLAIFLVLNRSVIRPITALMDAADAVASLREVGVIPVYSDDELGSLARNMEQMAEAIQGYRIEKEQWQHHLESQIAERTAELQVVNNALQHEVSERQRVNAELQANEGALNLALELKQASEERFRAIFESARDGIFVCDRELRCLYANDAAIRQIGTTRDKLIGRNMGQAVSRFPDIRNTWVDRIAKVFETERSHSVEDEFRINDKVLYGESVLSPILDGQGTLFAVGVIYRDITTRKTLAQQIREALELNEKIVSSSSVGIAAYNKQGRCILANQAMAAMIGATREAVLVQNFNDLDSWKRSGLLDQAEAILAGGGEVKYEIQTISSFGQKVWLNCLLSSFVRHGEPHLLLIIDDISEGKRLQAQLEERNKALEESNRELDDFAYIASHDLREPLRGIANYAAFIMEDYADKLDADGNDKLQTLIRLCEREDQLIDSLLEYSRVGRTELDIQPVDLNRIVEDVLERIAPVLADAKVAVRIPGPLPTIACDPIRIGEVYFNLITNAVKYNDKEDKWIEIGSQEADNPNATSTNEDEEHAINGPVLYVRDNGIGIREGQESQIFNIFKRLHGRDKYGGGVGAGLTIVKKIIERHNGSTWVSSTVGQGTTFYFKLESAEI